MIKWSIDPRDWEKLNTPQVKAAVLENAAPNQIILLHDIYDTSVDAALEIVDTLQGEGYRFVTVQELLEANGIQTGGRCAVLLRRHIKKRPVCWHTGAFSAKSALQDQQDQRQDQEDGPNHLWRGQLGQSRVLALLRDRKESATPPMAPERPALLPDWKSTMTMTARPQRSCRIVMTSVKASIQDNLQNFQPCSAWIMISQMLMIP